MQILSWKFHLPEKLILSLEWLGGYHILWQVLSAGWNSNISRLFYCLISKIQILFVRYGLRNFQND